MNDYFIFLFMIFMHIVDDYYLQGVLAKLKQKKTWDQSSIYKNDYYAALIEHGMSWAFCVMLPIAIARNFKIGLVYALFWILMSLIHAYIDNEKANNGSINLIQDQLLHLLQIWTIFLAYITHII